MAFAPGSSKSIWNFDPRSIPGCQTWLDASDSNTITYSSGSNVSIWKDKAPYGNNARRLQGTPIRVSNAMNGLPAMYLDGSNATSAAFTGTCPPNVTNQLTVFAVFTVESGVQDAGRLFSLMYPDYQNPNSMMPLGYNTGSNTLRVERNSSGYNATSNALTFGTPTLAACVVNGATTTIHMNGTQILSTSTVSSNLAYTYYTIGCFGQARGVGDNGVGPWNGYTWKGYVGEIILYSNALSTAQRQQVEGYLAWKWGFKTSTTTPTSIGGLALWLDAADASTLTLSGSNITSWNDKSGNGNNATATGTPTYNTAGLNTRPATAFNGSCYFQGNVSITGQTLTCFAVGSFVNSGGGDQRFVSLAATGQADWNSASRVAAIFNQGSTTSIASYRNQPATFPRHSHSYGTPFIACSVYDGTNGYIYVNGLPGNVQASYASAGTFAISKYCIGEQVSVTGEIIRNGGFVSEVLTYTTALTTVQRQQVEGYLSKKWGVSLVMSLPFTHPFYSIGPGLRTFRPIDIDGCALWLDANDATTFTLSGSNITSWNDKSGTANHAVQGTASNRPTYATDSGYPAVAFSGSAQYLFGTNPLLTSTSMSMFIVHRTTNTSATQYIFFDYKVIGSNYVQFVNVSGSYSGNITYAQSPYTDKAFTYSSTSNRTMTSFVDSPTNTTSNFHANGSLVSTTLTNGGISNVATDAVGYALGAFRQNLTTAYGGSYFQGYIYEVIVYPSALTTAQRQQVEGYLAKKWNLSTVVPPFTNPTSIPGCTLWLDAQDSSTITGTSTVTQWRDKSGLACNTTAYYGSPALTAAAINGYQAISFNGSSYLFGSNSNSTTTATFFFVGTMSSSVATYAAMFSFSPLNTNSWGATSSFNGGSPQSSGTRVITPQRNASGASSPKFTPGFNTPFIFTNVFDGTNWVGYGNGITLGSMASTGNFAYTKYVVGSEESSGGTLTTGWTGYIGELIAYNTALTATQRQQVEYYLSTKWGLTTASSFSPSMTPGLRL